MGEQVRSSSRRTSEEGGQLGCLGGMHYSEDLVSRLQDEVRTWDQELTTADDRRSAHSFGNGRSRRALPTAWALGCTCSSTKAYCPLRSLSSVIMSPGLCGGPGPCDPHQL